MFPAMLLLNGLKKQLSGACVVFLSTRREAMTEDDPKIPTRPIEEPSERPDEVPPEGGDVDYPGGTPEEAPENM
jgi:hypothetical protein